MGWCTLHIDPVSQQALTFPAVLDGFMHAHTTCSNALCTLACSPIASMLCSPVVPGPSLGCGDSCYKWFTWKWHSNREWFSAVSVHLLTMYGVGVFWVPSIKLLNREIGMVWFEQRDRVQILSLDNTFIQCWTKVCPPIRLEEPWL